MMNDSVLQKDQYSLFWQLVLSFEWIFDEAYSLNENLVRKAIDKDFLPYGWIHVNSDFQLLIIRNLTLKNEESKLLANLCQNLSFRSLISSQYEANIRFMTFDNLNLLKPHLILGFCQCHKSYQDVIISVSKCSFWVLATKLCPTLKA